MTGRGGKYGRRGKSPRQARILRLRERFAVEQDQLVRALILAQLRFFGIEVDGK